MRLWWSTWRLWSGASPNRRIFAGALTIGVVTVGAKLIALGKELAIAAWFGRSDQLEAYLLAVLLPLLVGGIIGGSFTGAVVPALARAEQHGGRVAADRLFGGLLSVALPVMIVLATVLALAGGAVLPYMAGGFSEDKLALTRELWVVAAPLAMLAALVYMLTAPFHGRERFVVSALTPAITPGVVLIGILLMGADVGCLVTATLIGQVAEIVVLLVTLRLTGHHPWPVWPRFTGDLGNALRQWWPAIVASAIHASTAVIDQVMAAHLIAGSVAALGYGQRLLMMPLYLTISMIGPAFLVVLSRTQISASTTEITRIADWWRRRLLWVAAAGSVVVMMTAPWVTSLVFERGSFTEADTAEVALVVAAFAPVAPWLLVGTVSLRLLNVMGGNHYLPVIATVNLFISVVGNLLLVPYLGVVGVALAGSLVYFVSFLQIEWCLRRLRTAAQTDGVIS
jgi:putative peptidoglycan lipid II flippase